MRMKARNDCPPAGTAKPLLIMEPIHPALPWAETALLEQLNGLHHLFFKLTLIV
jgi:hypothetical protein